MVRAEEKNRSFAVTDAEMLQASRVMHGLFVEDKADFVSFDNSFDDPYTDNWNQIIEECGAIVQDSSYLDSQAELTHIVEDKMEECRAFFISMKYFVEKAFPGKKEIWNRLGFDDYQKVRRNQTKMIQFLSLLYQAATEYSVQLIAAGFTQDKIDQINILQSELTTADYNQELSKKRRPLLTQQRIEKLNECYEFMQNVSKAGKIIYSADFAKYEQYLLPYERTQKTDEGEETSEEEPVV